MCKTKSKFLIIALLALMVLVIPNAVKAAENLPNVDNNKITLTENVTLAEKYVVPENTTLEIDLNGCTLTGPSNNYTIENLGNLTIVDSKNTGKIVGVAPNSSCVRNLGTLIVNNATIESAYVAIKNDAVKAGNSDNPTSGDMQGKLTVQNSTISSTYEGDRTGTILNWGNATVTDSTVKATENGNTIYAMSGSDAGMNSEITINNSTLEGKYTVYAKRYSSSDTTTTTVTINGGTIKELASASALYGKKGSTVKVKGTVNGPICALKYAEQGANIILNKNVTSSDVTVPEGVTLTIPEDKTFKIDSNRKLVVNGTVNGKVEDANVYVKEQKAYYPTLYRALYYIDIAHNVKIMNDLTETKAITSKAGKEITIDLAGHTVNVEPGFTNTSTTTMAIIDSSEDGTGKIVGTITNKGTLAISGGTYTEAPVTEGGATTTLAGGTYPIGNIESATIPETMEIVTNEDNTYSIVYKPADYTAVDVAIEKASQIDKTKYTTSTVNVLENALSSVERGKNILEQAEVDEMATNIEKAISNLKEILELSSLTQSIDTSNKDYTGKSITINIVLKDEDYVLKSGTDYDVSYKNNTNLGIATVTIKGKGDYKGTISKTFKIVVGKVKNLTTSKQSTSSITAKWTKDEAVTGYEVYMATSKNGKYEKIATITKNSTTSYKKTKLSAGKNYYFKVRAYKTISGKKNYGAYSAVLTTATKPKAPSISKVTSKSENAKIKWNKVSGATGYEVYMKTSKNGKYQLIKTIDKNSTVSYTKKGLKANKTYYFKVRAYKTVNGKKIYSSDSTVKSVKVQKQYKVQKGDNLTTISKKFGTTVKKLVKLNNIKNKNLIRVGRILRIF